MTDQIPDTIDVIASEPDARHPMLDGAPVMIGDILVAGHPDDPYHRIEFHVGSLMYDDGRDLDSEVDRGWTVSPISIEFEDDAPYEWPLSECKRVSAPGFQVVPIVDDATHQEVEALIEANHWAVVGEHPCSGACLGCGAGVDDACDPDCDCDGSDDGCTTSQALWRLGPLIRFTTAYLGRTD